MSLSLHDREASALNTIYSGWIFNTARTNLTLSEKSAHSTMTDVALNRFIYGAFMFLSSSAGAILESIGLSLWGIGQLSLMPIVGKSMRPYLIETAEKTLLCFRLFSISLVPTSGVAFAALQCLPHAYEDSPSPYLIKEMDKHLNLGPYAQVEGANSFLLGSYSGQKIHALRIQQSNYEKNPDLTAQELLKSRIETYAKALFFGLLSAVEGFGSLTATLTYGSYTGITYLLKEKDLDKLNQLEKLTRQTLTCFAIFSLAVNPAFLLVSALEHGLPNTYRIPNETTDRIKPKSAA